MALAADPSQPAPVAAGSNSSQSVAQSKLAHEIAGRILTAYGGIEKLRELDAQLYRGKGKITEYSSISQAANTFNCEMTSKGDKIRIDINVMGQPVVTGYDGNRGWLKQGDQVFPADPATVKRIRTEIRHSLQRDLLNLADAKAKIALRKPRTVLGQLCDQLEVQGPDGEVTTICADQKTHLVLSSEWMGSDSEQGIRARVVNEFLDYRPCFGTMEPYKVVEYTEGKKTSEALQESIAIDNTVPETVFDMPAEIEMARLKQGPVTIPFEYDGHQILIRCKVNKNKTCVFVTDTGASQSIIDQNVANTLGQTKQSGYLVTTGSGSVQMNYMNLASLELGEVVLDNFPIGVMDGKAFGQMQGTRPDGLIGANILKRFLVTIDYEKKELILADPRSVVIPPGAIVVPTLPAMGNLGMIVEGKLDGKRNVTFLVDTGAAFNNISPKLVKPLVADPLLKVGKVLGMDGKQIDVGAVRLKTLELGSLKVPDPTFVVAIAPENAGGGIITSASLAVLGNPLWSHYRVTIDYRNNRLILEQSPQRKALDELEGQLQDVRLRMFKSKNYDAAIVALSELSADCAQKQLPGGVALCMAEMINANVFRGLAKDAAMAQVAEFDKALSLAKESGNTAVQARVMVRYVNFVDRLSKDFSWSPAETRKLTEARLSARQSITRAVGGAPSDPDVLCGLSVILSQTKPDLADKGFDQALAYDPANWDALWGKHKIARGKNDSANVQLIEAQLRRYYSGVPEVDALSKTPVGAAVDSKKP